MSELENPAAESREAGTGFEIAIIGMAGRFPGAADLQEFWSNLARGIESVAFLSGPELEAAGIPVQWSNHPGFVKSAGGVLENKEFFDAAFFGYSPREAELMDPQMRLLHECCWTALEEAGYYPGTYSGLIGLYAGSASNFKWEALAWFSGKKNELGAFAAAQLVDTCYLATRIAYKLNLKGPSVVVESACSTSLAAVNMACRALLSGECDMALAGGASLSSYPQQGYRYQEGMILSSDGHCRAFDARADGTVGGEGAGMVLLKALEDAVSDGDHIHAVIRSSAVNNDGEGRVGYSAPGVEGQAHVIRAALHMAEVEPESIGYIETHGTGTGLGDPIEIQALKLAFKTGKKGFCLIGSVKTNIGHLDRAAGIAGLIKTVLALTHRQIPPSLHFISSNPGVDFESSPFRVNTRLVPWKRDQYPLRAGVSSFGIGGTNAHVILEQAPEASGEPDSLPGDRLILLSAGSETALEHLTRNLVHHFRANPGIELADAAYTLQVGRKAFPHRRVACCSTLEGAIQTLTSPDPEKSATRVVERENPPVIFMFPGQGAQYVEMGRGLYESEPVFRRHLDRCFNILRSLGDIDLRQVLYPSLKSGGFARSDRSDKSNIPATGLQRTEIAQPLLFALEYALAKLIMHWGIKPQAMIGHSIGEYVAAHLAGVFSLEDALKLVALRGKLMQPLPTGSMISAAISEEQLTPLLTSRNDLSLAAVNSTRQCVVSGPHQAIAAFAEDLERKGFPNRPLHTSHAFHSSFMDPVLDRFREEVGTIERKQAEIPYISNLTGTWIKTGEIRDPGYWSTHLRHTVRFARGLTELLQEPASVFVEVGPGKGLCALVKQHADFQSSHQAVQLLRHPQEELPDRGFLYRQVGQLWLYGVDIHWPGFHSKQKRKRLALPTYCFERQRYWLEGDPLQWGAAMLEGASPLRKKPDMADWFYIPSWERVLLPRSPEASDKPRGTWLVLVDDTGLGQRLREDPEIRQAQPVIVGIGRGFDRISAREFRLDPGESHHYDLLFREIPGLNQHTGPLCILHLWGVSAGKVEEPGLDTFDKTQDTGLFSLLNLVRALGRAGISREIRIAVVTDHLQEVTGEETVCPAKATLLGAVKIIPLEYPNIRCTGIDVVLPGPGASGAPWQRLIRQLLEEFRCGFSQKVQIVAFRGTHRWQPLMKPYRLGRCRESRQTTETPPLLKQEGVYLVSGGLGGLGFTLAGDLARRFRARLILVGRSPLPPRQQWEQWLADNPDDTSLGPKIRKIREWESSGAHVMVCSADIANPQQMQEAVNRAENRFGPINGVIHTAGVADYKGVIQRRTRDMTEKIMRAKVKGTLVLDALFEKRQLDFLVLCSSIGNVLYKVKFGQVGYNAANEFLDSFAAYKTARDGVLTMAINWCDWLEVGMSVEAVKKRLNRQEAPDGLEVDTVLYGAVTPEEGAEVFLRILESRLVRIAVSPQDLNLLLQQVDKKHENRSGPQESKPGKSGPGPVAHRPRLSTEYAAPLTETEKKLAALWERFFGFEPVGRNDDFFQLGGDSLQVMTVSSHLQKILGLRIPLQVFFANPTIRQLAAYLREMAPAETPGIPSLEPVEEREYYPLGSAQKRIYILQQSQKESTGYNQPRVYTLETEPHRDALEKILEKLMRRHESLRTSFRLVAEEPVQIIAGPDEGKIPVEYYDNTEDQGLETVAGGFFTGDGSRLPVPVENENTSSPGSRHRENEMEGEWVKALIRDFVRPFDLAEAPLFRVGLIKLHRQRSVLLVDLHHIISDGTSNATFFRELQQMAREEDCPPLKLRYKDFSQWQNRQKITGALKPQEEFWSGEFKGGVPVLKLTLDYPRSHNRDFSGSSLEFALDEKTTSRLKEYAGKSEGTLFMVILALYNIFLAKLSGQEDIVVGTISLGRRHPDLARILGMFVNTLVLRNFPCSDKTVGDFFREVKDRTVQAFDNQDFQFDDLVEQMGGQRDPARNPLFDALLIHHGPVLSASSASTPDMLPAGSGEIPGNQGYQYDDDQTKFDLVLGSAEQGSRLHFVFGYSTALFKKETVQRFVDYFQEIIAAVVRPASEEMLLAEIKISHQLGEVETGIYQHLAGQLEF